MSARGRGPQPWTQHFQHAWEEKSANPGLPDWLRLVAIAYGKHRRNGHARFKRGDLSYVLAKVGDDGTMKPSANTRRAVNLAVDHGFLAPGSNTRCLIVPRYAVQGGWGGGDAEPCPEDHSVSQPGVRTAH